MKSLICTLIIVAALFRFIDVQSQTSHHHRAVIDTILHRAKHTSLNARWVTWDSLRTEMLKHASQAKSVHDLKPAFDLLLSALNDPHGKFINTADNSCLASYTAPQDPEDPNSQPVINVSKGQPIASTFEFKELEGGIGYMRIASIPAGADIQQEAALIRTAIDSLSKRESQRWIIDLRYLTGGELHPVLAGVAPLLGEGQVGSVVDNRSRIKKLYEIHNGNFYDDKKRIGKFTNIIHASEPRIAVLVSRHTAGTGQVVAITFKGRKNTKFFGEPTAGGLAITKQIHVTSNLIMHLSEGLYQDRIGRPYPINIEPDMTIEFESADPQTPVEADEGIMEAVQWLNDSNLTAMRK